MKNPSVISIAIKAITGTNRLFVLKAAYNSSNLKNKTPKLKIK